MEEKKVKLFIVEGPSDETAFGLIFERLFSHAAVRFDVVHGDITTAVSTRNPRDTVRDELIQHVEREFYEWGDLLEIVHIVDADGVFIPEDNVVTADDGKLEYCEDCIKAPDANRIRQRNKRKSETLRSLCSVTSITYGNVSIPYRMYYLSRNLEHALHGVIEDVSDRRKEELARAFRKKYKDDLEGFTSFMRDEIGVEGDFDSTWRHLREGVNSLSRGSNVHLVLSDREQSSATE